MNPKRFLRIFAALRPLREGWLFAEVLHRRINHCFRHAASSLKGLDWRAQLLLEQVKEAESEQALDRLRLLRGEGKDRQVYILSNVPLNVTVDFGWSWKEYQKSVEVLRACSWLVPKKTKDLLALIQDILERAARGWLKELKTAESLIRNTIRASADS
jgi:hypothetical protein